MIPNPLLFIGYGNPARGDDGAGPEVIERLEALKQQGVLAECFDTVADYQLQIELAADMRGRKRVWFIDASVCATPPFQVTPLKALRDASFTSHELSPQALLFAFKQAYGDDPPLSELLAVAGSNFEFDSQLLLGTKQNIDALVEYCTQQIRGYRVW